jgi:hypothetical protein
MALIKLEKIVTVQTGLPVLTKQQSAMNTDFVITENWNLLLLSGPTVASALAD